MPFSTAPKVVKKDLEQAISQNFNIGKLMSYKKLKKGFANSLYYLKTTKGEFVFKIAVRHNSYLINYEVDLLNFLQGLPIPKLVQTKSHDYVFIFKGHRTFIYRFLTGKESTTLTRQMLYDVGKFLGNLHRQTQKFYSPIRRTEFYAISPAKLKRVVRQSRSLTHPKIRTIMAYLQANALKYPLSAGLPKGAMHIDVKPENTLFLKGRLSGVVDFDNSYIGPLVFDLADTLMWFCSRKGKFDTKRAQIILKGYESARKLNSLEQDYLMKSLHKVYLAIALCGIDYLSQKKLPQSFIIWIIDNLLAAEKSLDPAQNKL